MSAYLIDLAERVGFTYLYAFVSLLLADSTGVLNVDALKAAALAAIPAALAVLKGALARFVGNPETAGFTG